MRYLEARQRHLSAVKGQLNTCKPNIHAAGANAVLLEKYTEIRSVKDWEGAEKHFVQMAREFKVISYDTESFKKGTDSWSALESIIIGLFDGTCLDLNIVSLKKEAHQNGKEIVGDLRSVLPNAVVDILADGSVFKLGSQIGIDAVHDQDEFKLEVNPVFDCQVLHCKVEDELSVTDLEGHGMGRLCYDIFRCDYKPQDQIKYFRRYGQGQPKAWQKHAHHRVYEWKRPLSPYAKQYKILDSLMPLSCLSWIVEHSLENHLVSRQQAA